MLLSAERSPAIAATLALYAWNDGVWQKLSGSDVKLATWNVTGATAHSGVYAVFGATNQAFLPVTLR